MFGMNRRPRGLFANFPTYGSPGIGDDIERQKRGEFDDATPGVGMGEAPARKPGMFGRGGVGRAIAGTIGDVLLQRGGLAPIYGPTMALKRKEELASQQGEIERQRERDEWLFRQKWERDNPMPSTAQPYRFEDNAGNVWEIDPTGKPKRVFTDVVPKMYVQGDQAVRINNPFLGGAPDTIDEDTWNSGTPVDAAPGGATPPASRPFPGSFPDPLKGPGRVTSMRRTIEGNRDVGGVPRSRHLTGEAVDVVGATPAQLRAYYGQNANIGWHKNHHHVVVPGAKFPFFGKRGAKGSKR